MVKNYKNKIKEHFQEVLKIKTSPREIAIGFGIGSFFANFPTFGLEFLIIFIILILFKRVSKISLIFAYIVWNPLITYPLAVFSYLVGNFILGDAPIITIRFTILQEVIRFTVRYMVGSLITATILAIASYWAMYYLAKKYQEKNPAPKI
jgi:uncharacterized protein